MFFTMRGSRLTAWFCSLLLVGMAVISVHGCASDSTSAAGPVKTKAPAKPVDETVSVDLKSELGMFAPRAHGVLRPSPATQLPGELLKDLGMLARGNDGGPTPMLVTVGDVVKYDGAYPGQKANWAKWDKGVEALVRKMQSEGRPVIYEVWKEPDNGRPFKDRLDFFSTWVHTTRLIRKLSPGAVMVGPSMQKFDGGWIGEFLKVCKEYKVLPDIVVWHEDGLKHNISGHVGGMGETFWQDGSNIRHVIISPNARIDEKQNAGDPAIFLGQMERSIKDNAFRRISQDFEFKLTHLFTNKMEPRSNYFTFKQYAAMAGGGQAVKVNGSGTVDGVAVWSAPGRIGRVLLGRNRSRVDVKQILGKVTLQIKGAAGAAVHVRMSRIEDSGSKASKGPAEAMEAEQAIKNGEASFLLPEFANGDAYSIEFTVVGNAPSTQPATTHHSATQHSATLPAKK
jgi:hypothetical protein